MASPEQNDAKENYSGASGWGRLDPKTGGEEQSAINLSGGEVQYLLFSNYDPSRTIELSELQAPITDERRSKPRKKVVLTREVQPRLFEEESEDEGRLVEAPEPDLQDRRVRDVEEFPREIHRLNGTVATVPETVTELIERYPADHLYSKMWGDRHEQLRGIAICREIPRSLMLEAATAFGKTNVQLADADMEISEGGLVLMLTPRDDLVDQIAIDDAGRFFDFPEGCLRRRISGRPETRLGPLLDDPRTKIIIGTPEGCLNDLLTGSVHPSQFTSLIIDEAHRAVGDTATRKIASMFRDAGVKIRAHSATIPDKDERVTEFLDALGITQREVYRLHSPEKPVFARTAKHRLKEPVMREVADSLYEQIADAAVQCIRELEAVTYMPETGYYVKAKKLLDFFVKKSGISRGKLLLLDNDQQAEIREMSKAAERDLPEGALKEFRSCLAELGYRMHLYRLLSRFGKVSFLHYVADEAWAARFNCRRSNGSPKAQFFARVYRDFDKDSPLALCVRKLTGEKLYSQLASRQSVGSFAKQFGMQPNGRGERWPKPEEVRKVFLSRAMDEIVQDEDWFDGPLNESALLLVERHCTFGKSAQVMIYSEDVNNTRYLQQKVERILEALQGKAVQFTGTKSLAPKDRKENLRRYREKKATVLVGNDSVCEGLNSESTILIKLSHPAESSKVKQLLGRIGRKGEIAIVYNELLSGSEDQHRFYAGWMRLRRQRSFGRQTS